MRSVDCFYNFLLYLYTILTIFSTFIFLFFGLYKLVWFWSFQIPSKIEAIPKSSLEAFQSFIATSLRLVPKIRLLEEYGLAVLMKTTDPYQVPKPRNLMFLKFWTYWNWPTDIVTFSIRKSQIKIVTMWKICWKIL